MATKPTKAASKTTRNAPKTTHNAPKTTHNAPKTSCNTPKTTRSTSRNAPEATHGVSDENANPLPPPTPLSTQETSIAPQATSTGSSNSHEKSSQAPASIGAAVSPPTADQIAILHQKLAEREGILIFVQTLM